MKWIQVKVENDVDKIKLTRLNGDTFTSTGKQLNEELGDFLHSPDPSPSTETGQQGVDKDWTQLRDLWASKTTIPANKRSIMDFEQFLLGYQTAKETTNEKSITRQFREIWSPPQPQEGQDELWSEVMKEIFPVRPIKGLNTTNTLEELKSKFTIIKK